MTRQTTRRARRDEGSSLILALVVVLVGTLMVLPVMDYTMAVIRANRTVAGSTKAIEAVKAGLPVALQNPARLYQACSAAGLNTPVALAAPPMSISLTTECLWADQKTGVLPDEERYALTAIQAGAVLPAPYVAQPGDSPELDGTVSSSWCTSLLETNPALRIPCGRQYPGSGQADPTLWVADTSATTMTGKVWLPTLPPVSNRLASSTGYPLPYDGPCTIYFPGRYKDPLVITDATPVYFASGIYYFEDTVRISGDAHIVVGAGSTPGCVESDAVAVADAAGAPADAYSNGVGGTWVFGDHGRLVIDTATASTGTGASIVFNRRLVATDDPLAILNDISIMSVNGELSGASVIDLDRDLNADTTIDLHVPKSMVEGTPPDEAPVHHYAPSLLVSTAAAPTPCGAAPADPTLCPIIDIDLTSTAAVALDVRGYVAVPQGSVSVVVAEGAGVGKSIAFGGGILASQFAVQMPVSSELPYLQLGLVKTVVQQTFRIITETSGASPNARATALIELNESGGYKINSWVLESGI